MTKTDLIHSRSTHSLAARICTIAAPLLMMLAQAAMPVSVVAQFEDEFLKSVQLGGFGVDDNNPGDWSAVYSAGKQADSGVLEVSVILGGGWHVYSIDQKPGVALPTVLKIQSPAGVQLTGPWEPNEPPTMSVSGDSGESIAEHSDMVVFSAPVKLPAGFAGELKISVEALACRTGKCVPIDEVLTVAVGDADAAVAFAKSQVADAAVSKQSAADQSPAFRDGDYVVEWRASLADNPTSSDAASGDAMLSFTVKPDPEYHVYTSAVKTTPSSTVFVVTEKSDLKVGAPVTASKVVVGPQIVATIPAVNYHKGTVNWQLPLQIADGDSGGKKTLSGFVIYQACTDKSCHRPVALSFKATVDVDPTTRKIKLTEPVKLASAKFALAADAAEDAEWTDKIGGVTSGAAAAEVLSEPDEKASMPLGSILGLAFVAGLILNVMPCVLPVVGLKVMGFVSQAGEDKKQILMLNAVYSLGIMFVFAILAGLSSFLSFGWGEQFTFFPVRFGLTILLFALALSYLGVWEIPAPGMASNKASQEMQGREGYTGAFAKGAFATVLSTPCSGPLLGAILGLTLSLSGVQTFAVIMTVGFGMASPYILLGLNPKLIGFLPKPGPWMETFKQFLAFLLLGTVAFFFAGFVEADKVPVFISLIAVWFGCWIVGQVPNWQSLGRRASSWVAGSVAAIAISWSAFHFLAPVPDDLPWQPYNEARLQELTAQGNTVLLDFTASWCVNCKVNTALAIDTQATAKLVHKLGAIPMLADWSDRSNPAIKAKVNELKSNSIPLLVIYPGRQPDQPIILRDLVSQADVLEALSQAGPSLGESDPPAVTLATTSNATLAH